jgi:hypothetical protein
MNRSDFRKSQVALPFDFAVPAIRKEVSFTGDAAGLFNPEAWLPPEIGPIVNHQTALPRIARDHQLVAEIERRLPQIPSEHHLFNADARDLRVFCISPRKPAFQT